MGLQQMVGNQVISRLVQASAGDGLTRRTDQNVVVSPGLYQTLRRTRPAAASIIQRYTKDDVEKRAHTIYKERIAVNPPPGTQTQEEGQRLAAVDWAKAEDDLTQIEARAHAISEDRKKNPQKYPQDAGEVSDWLQAEKEIDLKQQRASPHGALITSGVKPEYVPDTAVGLEKRFPGVAGQGLLVVNPTAVYDVKPVPDPPPHPDAGGLLVDTSQLLGTAPQAEAFFKRGTFFDAVDPKYRTDFYGVSELKFPFDPNAAILAVAKDDVRDITVLQQNPIDAMWKASADALFPGPHPLIDDLQQGSLADCGLLAALGSLMAKDRGYVKGMMRDNGKGTVTVRFFDISEVGSARPNTYEADPGRRNYVFTPRYIEVDKSELVFKNDEEEQDVYNPPNVKTVPAGSPALNKGALWVQILEKAFVAAGYLSETRQQVAGAEIQLGNIEGGDPGIAFEHLVGKPSSPSEIAKQAPANIPAPSGPPPIYHAGQIAAYERIRRALNAGELVSAWTEDKVDKVSAASANATGHSGGEDVAEGLVGQHAYSVIGCDPPGGNLQPTTRCFVTVRNPWGHYGRQFDPATDPVPTVQQSPTSRIELGDFVTRFKRIVTAPGP